MYQEELAEQTADHLRTHIEGYLDEIAAKYTGLKYVDLVVPKSIEPASVVGGLWTEFDNILPAYGIDVLNISPSEDSASLWTHAYDGQINGLVSAGSRQTVDRLCSRHAQAVEHFIEQHLFFHWDTQNRDVFSVVTFFGGNLEFSGAEDLGEQAGRPLWLAGFSLNCTWLVSQEGPAQHA
jgi:hypothetical protein